MLTIFFVHGTGVRRQAYNDVYAVLNRTVSVRYPTAALRTCYWGDACGARLHHHGLSIPDFTPADDRAVEPVEDPQVQLWAHLYIDPLYELAVVGAGAPATFSPDSNAIDDVVDRLRHWIPDENINGLADEGGVRAELADARDLVVTSDGFDAAIGALTEPDADALAEVLARAVVAAALYSCTARGRLPLASIDPDLRDRLVATVAAQLSGRTLDTDSRAIGALVRKPVTDVLTRGGTFFMQRNRDDLFDQATPLAGDVVLYQTHGEPFIDFIANEIQDAERPVVLLAHSLGGVACFDLLVRSAQRGLTPPVDLLVTVGSQAPYLYEIGASRTLRPDDPLPPGFPAWLNVFAPRDFLSYRAHDIFPQAVDVQIDLRQPFPRSHSSYWANDRFWAALDHHFKLQSWV